MMEFINAMRTQAQHVVNSMGVCRWGIITSSKPTDTGYAVKVRFGEAVSGWLPVLSQSVGAGWGVVSPPMPGMQAFVAPDTGNSGHMVVLGMAYSQSALPPVPNSGFDQTQGTAVSPGEIALVSQTGTVLRLCADGSVYIQAPVVRIQGDLVVQGNITAKANSSGGVGEISDRHGTVDTVRSSYNAHRHGNSSLTDHPVGE